MWMRCPDRTLKKMVDRGTIVVQTTIGSARPETQVCKRLRCRKRSFAGGGDLASLFGGMPNAANYREAVGLAGLPEPDRRSACPRGG